MTGETKQYTEMQRRIYEHSDASPDFIVGNYAWHEAFPYETFLLHENGDIRYPVLTAAQRGRALDFGCGPGRMIRRMSSFFDQVDGVDIAPRLLEEARRLVPASSQLWEGSGDDLGGAPKNAYDFIYCTISMQHIAVWDVRMRIMRLMRDALKVGGCITLQMAFNPHYPFLPADHVFSSHPVRGARTHLLRLGGQLRGFFVGGADALRPTLTYRDPTHAAWRENKIDAASTNGGCDVAISSATLPQVREDFEGLFGNFACWWYDVSLVLNDLRGERHDPNVWATHWIFLHARKTSES